VHRLDGGDEFFTPRTGALADFAGWVIGNLLASPAAAYRRVGHPENQEQGGAEGAGETIGNIAADTQDAQGDMARDEEHERAGVGKYEAIDEDQGAEKQSQIDYPAAENEREILRLSRAEARGGRQVPNPSIEPLSQSLIRSARNEVLDLYMNESLERYLLEIVLATRNPGKYGDDLSRWLQYGASPRATIGLDRVSRARAWLDGRDYVSPEDIQEMVKDVLGHRIVLSYEAEAEGMSADAFLGEMMSRIAVP